MPEMQHMAVKSHKVENLLKVGNMLGAGDVAREQLGNCRDRRNHN